ncbi:1-deoxy-D-xylulose-5-phosphate reductoisomerase [Saezia sanguinis]|uniref:1-deoxy-D-xylulose-5-phosphate reductoisomerase n=1 Tax=Saezia sanguinis TaxID=1965230 RepID=UPI00306CDF4A
MRITVLGSTGSIGRNTLNVLSQHPERYEVFALTAASQVDLLAEQCIQFKPRYAVMPDEAAAARLRVLLQTKGSTTEVLGGAHALEEVACAPEADAVMAAIVGAAGLKPALAAAAAGKRLLLANKEALVVAGALFMRTVEQGKAGLFPVDSEHSAVFQCLPQDRQKWGQVIEKIILTASGGPFRTRDPSTLSSVTPEEACAHPNWRMGRKISVDSATMMNKALEVIEARWLFDTQPERIEAVIHPQSVVHSMIQCVDGSVMAQMGVPDMRVPIAVSLAWPERVESGAQRLDFTHLSELTFEAADNKRFPCLPLAWQALTAPEGTTAVLNAANEVAVEAFLHKQLRFDQIYHVVSEMLEHVTCSAAAKTLDDLFDLDMQARSGALSLIQRIGPL